MLMPRRRSNVFCPPGTAAAVRVLSLLALVFALISPTCAQQNPQIPRGTSRAVPATGTEPPAVVDSNRAYSWDIVGPYGFVIATHNAPNGYSVVGGGGASAPSLRVYVPANAQIAPNYKARLFVSGFVMSPYSGMRHTNIWNAKTPPAYQQRAGFAGQTPVGTTLSGPFDVAAAPTIPAAPTNLTATALSPNEIALQWTNVTPSTSIYIERREGSGPWYAVGGFDAGTTSFTDSYLEPQTTYSYRVQASNEAGYSGFSNIATATTFPEATPDAPTNLVATAASATQINLSWEDNSGDETGFVVQRKGGTNLEWADVQTLPANTVSWQNTGLTVATAYTYRVAAIRDAGLTLYSNEANATTLEEDSSVPAQHRFGGAEKFFLAVYATGATSTRLYWESVPGAAQYRIYRSETPGQYDMSAPNAVRPASPPYRHDDSSLQEGINYYYIVEVVLGDGQRRTSQEDDDITTSSAIPWHSTPVNILSQAYATLLSVPRAEENNGTQFPVNGQNLLVLAPDGSIYSAESPNASLPADGHIDYSTGTFMQGNGRTQPATHSEVIGVRQTGQVLPRQPDSHGGIRRLCTVLTTFAANSIVGVGATFFLPNARDIRVPRTTSITERFGVSPHAYVGIVGDVTIDAGISYFPSQVIDGVSYVDRWNAVMRISDGRPQAEEYISLPITDRFISPDRTNKFIPVNQSSSQFTAVTTSVRLPQVRAAVFDCHAYDFSGPFYSWHILAAVKSRRVNFERDATAYRAKVVVSLDQTLDHGRDAFPLRRLIDAGEGLPNRTVSDGSFIRNMIVAPRIWNSSSNSWESWSNEVVNGPRTQTNPWNYFGRWLDSGFGPVTVTGQPTSSETISIVH